MVENTLEVVMVSANSGNEAQGGIVNDPGPVTEPNTEAAQFCAHCGTGLAGDSRFCQACGRPITANPANVSPKSRLTATLLCGLLGWLAWIFGIHRLYLGKTGTGVIMLVLSILGWTTIWIFGLGLIFLAVGGIWQLVDFILLLSGSMKDGNGQTVTLWTNNG